MEVVLGPGWPGVMLHEAVGHGLEGDFNRKGTSVFSGKIGEKVASKGVTVIDDGTIPNKSPGESNTFVDFRQLARDGLSDQYNPRKKIGNESKRKNRPIWL